MGLNISKINSRQYKLNFQPKPISENYSNIRLIDESKHIFFESNAINVIRHWECLDENSNKAFEKALDAFNLLLENSNSSMVNTQCNFLVEAASKVRDASQLKNSIKYRLSRIKSKIIGNLDKKKEDVNGAVSNSLNNAYAKKPLNANGQRTPEDKEKIARECYTRLLEEASELIECDRIVKNYSSIHNRFNIDGTISKITEGNTDLYGAIYSIASYIDTFATPFKNRYNSALETCWYGLNLKRILCNKSDIIEAVTDYYIFNGGLSESEITDIKSIPLISPIFEEYDFDILSYLDDEVPEETVSDADFDFYGADYDSLSSMKDLEETAIDKIIGLSKEKDPEFVYDKEIKELLSKFRAECAMNPDNVTNMISFKSLINSIIEKCPDQIVFEFNKIISIMRMVFIISGTKDQLKQCSSLINDLIKAAIDLPIIKPHAESMITCLEIESKYFEEKIKKFEEDKTDCDALNRFKLYIKDLSACIESLKEFVKNSFEDSSEDENTYKFDDDFESDDTNVDKDEDGLTEAASIIMISELCQSIAEDLIDPDVTSIIVGNVEKMNNDVLDSIVDFSVTVPSIIDKEKLSEALITHRDSLRSSNGISISNWIRIDCINDNISKLAEARVYNTYNDTKGIIAYLMCLDEIKRINSNSDSRYFTEAMSFTNTLKIAINNLKHKAIKLSEKEKQASNAIDGAVNGIIRNMDRQMSAADREAIARGSILPSASKCIKIALVFAAAWCVNPAIAIIGALGAFYCKKKSTQKERQLALDEIEVELKMCERYLRIYEDQQNMQAVRQCEIIQRNLQRQYQRIKYKMKVDFKNADISSAAINTSGRNDY